MKKNQNYLIRDAGGKRNFYYNVLGARVRNGTISNAVARYVREVCPYTIDRYKYLERTIPGFTPKPYAYKDLEYGKKYGLHIKNGLYVKAEKVNQVFDGMMTRDGVKLYEQIKKEHPEW